MDVRETRVIPHPAGGPGRRLEYSCGLLSLYHTFVCICNWDATLSPKWWFAGWRWAPALFRKIAPHYAVLLP